MLTITHSVADQNRLSAALANGEPFRNAGYTFHGSSGFMGGYGVLPDELRAQLTTGYPRYVIYSYDTPIAWRAVDGTWTVPAVTYSPTTTQHQYIVRAVLAQDQS